MKFLRIVKRRTFVNEVVYVSLNIGLSITLLFLVHVTNVLWPAIILVILSMWRVFAVRPQFWFANIQANLVSTIVSFGYVVFLHLTNSLPVSANTVLIMQVLLAALYAVWLVLVKPLSRRKYVIAQAGIALFIGVTVVFAVGYDWVATPVVLLMWLIGYATSRHVLGSYEEEDRVTLLSSIWGFVLAEIGWLAYHWTIAYRLPIMDGVMLPQVSIIALCLSFLVCKVYDSYYHYQRIRFSDVVLPLIFTVGIICVLVMGFNDITSTTL